MSAPRVDDWATVPFHRSSRSDVNGGDCVEVGFRPGLVAVRDSKSPTTGLIVLPATAWAGLLATTTRS
ncbi:DUF397 domain-containing protein [Actinokineospora globicatena]|uniref:DUF397 domain-containing protein n=1 Tax=Actinokineospora globicatena TaxID=103729 RepID=UPI0020A400F9|nr:DUF397 domain-containing protein [Actinokineospora globicatena]MCP2302499.1 protein of unknown function (DUF397) [Actinokineospora globicatena]GLW75816.1 hypothetical protein Aglo01_02980 [Actinokineospora globicatena]GLW82654.1 hypothetical protein Aglo02_02950 [Actinokineospora globicatena]